MVFRVFTWLTYKRVNGMWHGQNRGVSLISLLLLQDGVSSQRPEVVVQAPYQRGSGDAAFPLTEEAEDGGLGEWGGPGGAGQMVGDVVGPCQGLQTELSPQTQVSPVFNPLQTLAKRYRFKVFCQLQETGTQMWKQPQVSETLHLT